MTTDNKALTDEGRPNLDRMVAQALEQAIGFRDHLALERRALVSIDADDLSAVFETKAELASALQALDDQRRALCLERFGTAEPANDIFIQALAPQSRDAWTDYAQALRDCQEANAVNGRLTVARQRHVRQALDILRGQPVADAKLYNASGATDAASNNQSLGSA